MDKINDYSGIKTKDSQKKNTLRAWIKFRKITHLVIYRGWHHLGGKQNKKWEAVMG